MMLQGTEIHYLGLSQSFMSQAMTQYCFVDEEYIHSCMQIWHTFHTCLSSTHLHDQCGKLQSRLPCRGGVLKQQSRGLGEANGPGQSLPALHWHTPGAPAAGAAAKSRGARALGAALAE